MEKMLTYLNNAISGFTLDPADTGFQHGYRAALMVMRDHVHDLIEEENMDNNESENVYQGADGFECYDIEVPLDTESLDDHPMSIAHRMERE